MNSRIHTIGIWVGIAASLALAAVLANAAASWYFAADFPRDPLKPLYVSRGNRFFLASVALLVVSIWLGVREIRRGRRARRIPD